MVEDNETLPVQVDGDDIELDVGQPVELVERDAFPTALPCEAADLLPEYPSQPIGERVLVEVARAGA